MLVREMILSAREAVKKDRELAALEAEKAAITGGGPRKAEIEARLAVLAKDKDREAYHDALNQLSGLQKDDFIGIFKAMQGRPVTIRLIDPPLHEFLPRHEQLLVETTEARWFEPAAALEAHGAGERPVVRPLAHDRLQAEPRNLDPAKDARIDDGAP